MQITLTDKVTSKDQDELRLGLNAHNSKFFDVDLIKPLGLFICDSQGKKLAGLTGTTTGNWLRIDLLWVSDSLRGQGTGSQLVLAAEKEARQRGCRFAQVDTASFQARPFYEKLGYHVRLTLGDYIHHHQRHYLTKIL
ncbi:MULTISPECIES: GNAT family N-acetyltransferase [Pantoea]|jgi:GNAT superfamily N-acetyltransferase|nr:MULTISPECIES: GNAT family N-acetyltransferase [Pantoea]AWQ19197.1 N-acetyltransferase [Pantoea ananatis]MBN6029383.1 GNAT family N-acetyltransferase [Pantoea ananatis]MCS3405571.1 GNAT family N-acetyltransferase [Pantoea sp. B566]MCW0305999.1 Acetyltransferase [Pantoea ananatis]MCW0312009.1 Acetyltransferase [Pantoea ananatis]